MSIKLANHKTLHFKSFLAKPNDSIIRKSPITLFLPFLGPFALNLENENPPRYGIGAESQPTIRHFIPGHYKQKPMTQFCAKIQKHHFWAPFPILQKMRSFPKNPALSLFIIYLTSCKISEIDNEPILRKMR